MSFVTDLREYVGEVRRAPWLPVPRAAAVATLVFYAWFLWYAIGKQGGDFMFLDAGNAVVHEGGHMLFSYFGDFMQVLGGTLLELLVPLGLAMAFYVRRQAVGFSLFTVVVFENLLYVAHYMSTARSLEGDYIAVGVGAVSGDEMDPNMHDWHNLFSRWGVLQHDIDISRWVFKLAWLGMLATVTWFAWRGWKGWGEEANVVFDK
jgi:hypothetical protein